MGDGNPSANSSPVRMVDFYEMAVKAGRQLGYSEEKIYETFRLNRKKSMKLLFPKMYCLR